MALKAEEIKRVKGEGFLLNRGTEQFNGRIITENGTNFAKGALARLCATQDIRLDLASVAHLQSNGQVERANGLILSGIKPRLVEPLERSAGCWLDELPAVL